MNVKTATVCAVMCVLVITAVSVFLKLWWTNYNCSGFQYWKQSMQDSSTVSAALTEIYTQVNLAVSSLSQQDIEQIPTEIDFVCAAGGFKSGYAGGAYLVLQRIYHQYGRGLVRRCSGASAGAGISFAILNDKLESVLHWSLAVAKTLQRYPLMHPFQMFDEFWRCTLPRQCAVPSPGMLSVSITNVTRRGITNEMVSSFASQCDVGEALISSMSIPVLLTPFVSLWNQYRGKYVIDGGVTNRTPIFDDNVRPQMVVYCCDRLKSRFPLVMHMSSDDVLDIVEQGVHDFVSWLRNPQDLDTFALLPALD